MSELPLEYRIKLEVMTNTARASLRNQLPAGNLRKDFLDHPPYRTNLTLHNALEICSLLSNRDYTGYTDLQDDLLDMQSSIMKDYVRIPNGQWSYLGRYPN